MTKVLFWSNKSVSGVKNEWKHGGAAEVRLPAGQLETIRVSRKRQTKTVAVKRNVSESYLAEKASQ